LDLSSKIIEYVKGIGIIKAFGKDENTVKELNDSIAESRKGFFAVEKNFSTYTISISVGI